MYKDRTQNDNDPEIHEEYLITSFLAMHVQTIA